MTNSTTNSSVRATRWLVADLIGRAEVATFVLESEAIAFSRGLNVGQPVGRFQVEREGVTLCAVGGAS